MYTRFFLATIVTVLLLAIVAGCGPRDLPEPPPEFLYAAVGTSDAVGVGAVPLRRGYAFRVRDAHDSRFGRTRLAILAIPAAEIREIQALVDVFVDSDKRPDVVTVWVGANDLPGGADVAEFEEELRQLMGTLRGWANGPVVVGNIPDLTKMPAFQSSRPTTITPERIEAFNTAIERQVRAHNAFLVDLHAEPMEDELVSDVNGIHPNNDGHRRMADLYFEAILAAMRER
jgi:lysophospholipase L1-like esterase